MDPALYRDYAGAYRIVDGPESPILVSEREGRLFVRSPMDGITFELYPDSETEFYGIDRWSRITFTRDARGAVGGLVLSGIDDGEERRALRLR